MQMIACFSLIAYKLIAQEISLMNIDDHFHDTIP